MDNKDIENLLNELSSRNIDLHTFYSIKEAFELTGISKATYYGAITRAIIKSIQMEDGIKMHGIEIGIYFDFHNKILLDSWYTEEDVLKTIPSLTIGELITKTINYEFFAKPTRSGSVRI